MQLPDDTDTIKNSIPVYTGDDIELPPHASHNVVIKMESLAPVGVEYDFDIKEN